MVWWPVLLVFGGAVPGWAEDVTQISRDALLSRLATFQRGDVVVADVAATRGWEDAAALGISEREWVERRVRELAGRELIARLASRNQMGLEREETRRLGVFHRHRLATAYLSEALDNLPAPGDSLAATHAMAIRRGDIERIAREVRAGTPLEVQSADRMGVLDDNTILARIGSEGFDAGDCRSFMSMRRSLGPAFIRGATPVEAFLAEVSLAVRAIKEGLHRRPEIQRTQHREICSAMSRTYLSQRNTARPTPSPEEIEAELEANREGPTSELYWGKSQIRYRRMTFYATPENNDDPGALAKAYLEAEQRAVRAYKLIQGGQDFARIAEAFGEGPESADGGLVGGGAWFTLDEIAPDVASILQELENGEIRPPHPDPAGGFYILQLLERRREPLPGDVRRKRARSNLHERKRRADEEQLAEKLLSQAGFKMEPDWWEMWRGYVAGE